MIAALLTRMSMPPNASTAACAIAVGGLRRADVDADADRPRWPLAAERLGGRGRGVVVDVGDHDGRARLGERLGVDDADAAGAAGDHGHLVGQVEQLCSRHGVDRTTSGVAKSSSLISQAVVDFDSTEEGEPWAIDRTVPDVHLHIGDERRDRGGGGVHQHVYPATGEVQGPVPLAGVDDVDDAVQAAHDAPSRPGGPGPRGSAATCSCASPTARRVRRRSWPACRCSTTG